MVAAAAGGAVHALQGDLALSWPVLGPALLVTIAGDSLINPFFVCDRYGSNPVRVARRATRDTFDNGHFNFPGQTFGAWVFAARSYLVSWGRRSRRSTRPRSTSSSSVVRSPPGTCCARSGR